MSATLAAARLGRAVPWHDLISKVIIPPGVSPLSRRSG